MDISVSGQGHGLARRIPRPLSEVDPNERSRRRDHELLKAPEKQVAHSAPRPSTRTSQSAVHPSDRGLNGTIRNSSPESSYVVDDVRRNLWPQQGPITSPSSGRSVSRVPSSTHRARSRVSQQYNHVPAASAGPSTSLAAVPAPLPATPSLSQRPSNTRSLNTPTSSRQGPSTSLDVNSHCRQSVVAMPPGLTARELPTLSPAPPSHQRPSLQPGTVNSVPRASPAYPIERLSLRKESKRPLQLAPSPTMAPPFLPCSGEEFDLFLQSRSSAWDFETDNPHFHDSEPPGDASEEIHKLFQNMPEIEIPPEDRANTPMQMSCKLMEHQKIALKWLKDQEKNTNKKGGLLADTMGLGKTIEALALIVAHRPPQSGPKTTLIVAPLALLRQWNREIADKIKPAHKLTTFIYHGREKRTRKVDRLYSYDIVITTYETIAYEYRRVEPDGSRKSPLFTDARGFYRIVLDEAHKIKNRNAWCSKAVTELRAEFRLCMTGTPFMNNTGEIFSLVRFLQIAPYSEWSHFSRHIEKPLRSWDEDEKAVAMQRLQVLFRSITLRRTKDSVLDGKPILRLPELVITSTDVELDEEQRAFYIALEEKHQNLVNKYLKHSKLSKVITYILVLLTRLRQTCDHPFLTEGHTIPDEARLNGKQMVQLAMRLDGTVVDRVLRTKEFQCPLCDESVQTPIIIYPCGHDICPDCFSTMMKFRIEAARNVEQSQAGIIGMLGDADDMETTCPHEGCASDIMPNKVLCHEFFLDAHKPGSASQVEEEDSCEEESVDCCTSGDDGEEDSEDDDGDLQDFIVSDGEEESEVDGDESDVHDATDAESERKITDSERRSRPDRKPTQDTLKDEDEVEEAGNATEDISHKMVKAEDGENKVKQESKPSLDHPPSPGPLVNTDGPLAQSRADPLSQLDREDSASVSEHSLPDLGNDIWGRVLTHHRNGVHASADVDSDSDLESLSGLAAKSKSKSATPAVGRPNPFATKRKRESKSEIPRMSRKRVKLEDHDEPKRISSKAGKKGKNEKKKDRKGKGKTFAELKKIGSTSKAAKAKYFDRLRRDWESSAKVDVTIDLLRKIRHEKPGEKTLVFSLWTSFLDLLEIPLQDEKFRYLRYDGAMTFNERDDNVKTFSEDRNENILLVSLMAGNAGLNLTAASQVIILEPFWNPFVEDQAIDRAHRIGQRKAVEVHRLLVPDSVEDRILTLQEKKRKLVNTALSEEGAQGASRLTIAELRGLFGLR